MEGELTSAIVIRYGLGVKHTTKITLATQHLTILAAARGRTPLRTSNVHGEKQRRRTPMAENKSYALPMRI